MDTFEAIRTVRVVRRFGSQPIPVETLDRILHAGRHAGSSRNEQRWAFIAVTDRETLVRLSKTGPWAGLIAGAAAAVALVSPDPRAPGADLAIMWDLGRAAQDMVLAAWGQGVDRARPPSSSTTSAARSWATRPISTASSS